MKRCKTFKREVAVGMLVFLAGLTLAGIGFADSMAWEAAKHFTVPIFSFAALAFGLDAYAKQTRPQQ